MTKGFDEAAFMLFDLLFWLNVCLSIVGRAMPLCTHLEGVVIGLSDFDIHDIHLRVGPKTGTAICRVRL